MNRSYDMQRAIDIYTNQIAWKDAMAQLYNTYKFDNEYKKALRVAQSLILEFPEQSDVYKMAGIMCLNLNDLEKASYYFYKYNQLEKSSKSAQLLASVYIKLNKMELANKILLDVKKRGFNDDALNDMLTEIQIVVK
jgi:uncharacterized protein HemY